MITKSFFNRNPLTGNQFAAVSASAIRAEGSLRDQLIALRAGLLDRLPSIFPELSPDSSFYGGTVLSGRSLPRYLEACLLTGALLGDDEFSKDTLRRCQQVVNAQREDGNFGDTGESFEARACMIETIMTAYQVTGDKQYLSFVLRHFKYLNSDLKAHTLSPDDSLHTGSLLLSGITLYNITGNASVLGVLRQLCVQSANFTGLYHTFPYRLPINRMASVEELSQETDPDSYFAQLRRMTNGVTLCEGLRTSVLIGLVTGDRKEMSAAEHGIVRMNHSHGAITGSITADPLLAGKSPTRGISLSASAALSRSIETLFTCTDFAQFADQWERNFYNTIEAAFSEDLHSVQLIQQANQVQIDRRARFPLSSDDILFFGLHDVQQICDLLPVIPRFVAHQWLLSRDEGLCLMGYTPSSIRYRIKDTTVRISVTSSYPGDGHISLKLSTSQDVVFPLRLRVPSWAGDASAAVGGDVFGNVQNHFITITREWHDGDELSLYLPMKPLFEESYHEGVSISRGPLVFAAPVSGSIEHVEEGNAYTPAGSFAHALVLDQPVETLSESGHISLRVQAVPAMHWNITDGVCDPPPVDVSSEIQDMHVDAYELTLFPYAKTVLRISVFPKVPSIH